MGWYLLIAPIALIVLLIAISKTSYVSAHSLVGDMLSSIPLWVWALIVTGITLSITGWNMRNKKVKWPTTWTWATIGQFLWTFSKIALCVVAIVFLIQWMKSWSKPKFSYPPREQIVTVVASSLPFPKFINFGWNVNHFIPGVVYEYERGAPLYYYNQTKEDLKTIFTYWLKSDPSRGWKVRYNKYGTAEIFANTMGEWTGNNVCFTVSQECDFDVDHVKR